MTPESVAQTDIFADSSPVTALSRVGKTRSLQALPCSFCGGNPARRLRDSKIRLIFGFSVRMQSERSAHTITHRGSKRSCEEEFAQALAATAFACRAEEVIDNEAHPADGAGLIPPFAFVIRTVC